MMIQIDPKKIETIIRDVSAKHIIPRFQSLKEEEIDTKTGPEDLVTAADIETEYALTEIFQKEFPECVVMGEEAVSRGEVSIEDTFDQKPDLLWVIDPVDGTFNFAHGIPIFACMVALQYKGETIMSWIYNVMKDEFAYAEKGQGATYNHQPISVSAPKPTEDFHGFAGRIYAAKSIRKIWQEKEQYVATVGGIRCAAHSYMRIARGVVDFHVYTKNKPWDHLAGELLIRESGGVIKTWAGEKYNPRDCESGLLIAPNETSWNELHDLFIKDVMELREKQRNEESK